MNFGDYEKKRELLYAQFAEMVKFVLETAIADGSRVPRPPVNPTSREIRSKPEAQAP